MTSNARPHPAGSDRLRLELESRLAHEQHIARTRFQAIFIVVLPLLALAVFFTFVGYQRHVIEIRTPAGSIRMISHRGPFEIISPYSDFPDVIPGGTLGLIRENLTGPVIKARAYDWASYASTQQVVTLTGASLPLEFTINDRRFILDRRGLAAGSGFWRLVPGATVNIDLDHVASSP